MMVGRGREGKEENVRTNTEEHSRTFGRSGYHEKEQSARSTLHVAKLSEGRCDGGKVRQEEWVARRHGNGSIGDCKGKKGICY